VSFRDNPSNIFGEGANTKKVENTLQVEVEENTNFKNIFQPD
jgi:hypothetical protein